MDFVKKSKENNTEQPKQKEATEKVTEKELTKEDILLMFPSGMKNAVIALIKYLKK